MAGFEVYNDKTDFDALLEMDFDSFAEIGRASCRERVLIQV